MPLTSGVPNGSNQHFGIFFLGSQQLTVGQAVGVHYQRAAMTVSGANSAQTARIVEAEHAGFGAAVTYTNVDSQPSRSSNRRAQSGPVTDTRAYQSALGVDLDATHPQLVVIENEEDGTNFSTATPAQYLQELSDAVTVAHAKGYPITNGGLTSTGLCLAYWHHLWLAGWHSAADEFARTAFTQGRHATAVVLRDLPTSADPQRPILAADSTQRALLQRSEQLIAGYHATGIDYVNFHWYQIEPGDMAAAVGYLERTTRLPAVTNELGQLDTNPATLTALLNETVTLRLPWVFWTSSDGKRGDTGLAGPTGALRLTGAAFADFIAKHQ